MKITIPSEEIKKLSKYVSEQLQAEKDRKTTSIGTETVEQWAERMANILATYSD